MTALDALDGWLRDAGFTAHTVAEGPGFGDRMIAYTRAPLEVTMTSDRDEWTLDVRHDDWPEDERYDLDIWVAALDGTGPPGVPSSLEVQAGALRERLDEIAARPELRGRLETIADARARARFGLGP